MRTLRTCGWCNTENEIHLDDVPVYCKKCGHRADVSRLACDCQRCMAKLDDTLRPLTPHQGD